MNSDYYNVIILIPKTGNRVIIENIDVEIEEVPNVIEVPVHPKYHFRQKQVSGISYLKFIITAITPPKKQFEKLKGQLLHHNELFLYFMDCHPNLISGVITSITMDNHKTTIRFKGNATNVTYTQYITEVATSLNAKLFYWNDEPKSDPDPDPGFKKKVHFRKKTKIVKRKLTF